MIDIVSPYYRDIPEETEDIPFDISNYRYIMDRIEDYMEESMNSQELLDIKKKWDTIDCSIDLTNFLHSLSDDLVRYLYSSVWAGSQRGFCKIYQVHHSNFSSWINYKRSKSNQCKRGVIEMLMNYPGYNLQTFKNSTCNLQKAYNILINLLDSQKVRTLVFVDGDQCCNVTEQMNSIIPHVDSSDWPIHIFSFIRNGSYPNVLYKYSEEPWITFVHTYTDNKNAADIDLTYLCSAMSTYYKMKERLIDGIFKPHIILISSDGFIKELGYSLKSNGLTVDTLESGINLGLWLLLNRPIEDLVVSEDKSLSRKIEKSKNLVKDMINRLDEYNPVLVRDIINIFREKVSKHDLLGMCPTQAAIIVAMNYKWNYSTDHCNISDISDQDLRLEYRIRWNGTQSEFSNIFSVSKSLFNQWMIHKKISDNNDKYIEVRNAIQRWIETRVT